MPKATLPFLLTNHCITHHLGLGCRHDEISYLKGSRVFMIRLNQIWLASQLLKKCSLIHTDVWIVEHHPLLLSVKASLEWKAPERSCAQADELATFVGEVSFVAAVYTLSYRLPLLAFLSEHEFFCSKATLSGYQGCGNISEAWSWSTLSEAPYRNREIVFLWLSAIW